MFSELFYYLTRPVEWAALPKTYSYSSLKQITICPFAWQVQHSKYDGFDKYPLRPIPAGVEGEIIHTLLEKLFRLLACHGMPLIGSETFQKCINDIDLNLTISRLKGDHEEKIAFNPRGAGFQLRSSIQQLRNKVIQIFREQYDKIRQNTPPSIISSLSGVTKKQPFSDISNHNSADLLYKNKVLTELTLNHSELLFKGVIDFIWIDKKGVKISDFKSGAYKPEHREQLLLHALLFKSNTGYLPKEAFIVYPESSERVEINENIISEVFCDLRTKITNANKELNAIPARANLHDNCQYCQVRQLCDKYWLFLSNDPLEIKRLGVAVDLEIEVTGIHGKYGLIGCGIGGDNVKVVYRTNVTKAMSSITCGKKLRILGGKRQADEIEIMPWTEVFHL